MAAKTLYLNPDIEPGGGSSGLGPFFGGNIKEVDTGAEATTATGWTVGKNAPTVYAKMNCSIEFATWTSTAEPNAAPVISNGVATDSSAVISDVYSGTFDAGVWALSAKVIAVTSGGDQDGRLRFRIWQWDGSTVASLSELTSGAIVCGTVTNLLTSAAQSSNGSTASIGPFTITNQRIMLQLAWEITGAGSASTRDVLLRKGTGITLVTPNFTASGATPARVIPTVVMAPYTH